MASTRILFSRDCAASNMGNKHTDLDDLGVENVSLHSTDRLEFVTDSLDSAEELAGDLTWQTELWEGVTVEEALGALIEADALLEQHREVVFEDYSPEYRIQRQYDGDLK